MATLASFQVDLLFLQMEVEIIIGGCSIIIIFPIIIKALF